MNHSYTILNAEIEHDHAGNSDFLTVIVQVSLGGEAVGDPRRFGFALDTEEAAIRAELDRVVSALDSDAQILVESAENDKKREIAQATIEALLTENN